MRAPNEIDFWRGFALVTIFINHIPGIYFERFTFRSLSLSDSAELFVFLAGCSLRILVDGPARALPARWLAFRLEARAFNVYVAQLAVTVMAIALLAAAALFLDAPYLLDWHNASAVFNDPVKADIGLVLLTHQLGYFNILPLYVVLLFIAPAVALIHLQAKAFLPLLSFGIYAFALISGVNLPTWPVEGTWFFNPFSWQFIYVLGFLLAGRDGIGGWAWRHRPALRWLAFPVVLLGAIVAVTDFSLNPVDVPEPKLLFAFDKTFLSPARLIHSLALTAIFAGTYKMMGARIRRPSGYLCLLGRNSLIVFCALSLLSLIGQILRFIFGGYVALDAAIIILGFLLLGFTAWAAEWRERFPRGIGRKAAFAAALGWLLMVAAPRAEDASVPPAVPPMSPPCDVPGADIAAPATLPNVTQALQKGEKVQILAIGSSSTLGSGASSKSRSYPSQLESILEHVLKGVDVVIVNRGVSGEVAETTAERIKSEVALKKPDLILWQLGTNDALARIPPQDFEQIVRSTIRWLKENRIDVVLVGMQYTSRLVRDPNYIAIRDSLQKIATEENILYVHRYDAMRFIAQKRANLQLMASDNFHLNDLGYQCMAEHVAHAVIVSLFVKRTWPNHK